MASNKEKQVLGRDEDNLGEETISEGDLSKTEKKVKIMKNGS